MRRSVILFAREPGREAREKGFAAPEAAELFTAFAAGWLEAARRCGARLILATPPEDRTAWRRRMPEDAEVAWLSQRGSSFGERLAGAARQVSRLAGHAVLVGGDVAPSPAGLAAAFEALEGDADAVLAPSEDGGVSLIGLAAADLDLLGDIAPRRRDVFASLARSLSRRGRRVAVIALPRDIDGPRDLRALLRGHPPSAELAALGRRALSVIRRAPAFLERRPGGPVHRAWPALRAPPRAA